jgi:hypothetical protein
MGSPFLGFQYQQKPEVSFLSPDYGAIQAGFKSAADQQANRMMRNQLEMKASQLGVSNQDAYKLVEGPLTNTSALQEAWNKLQAPAPQPPVVNPPPPTDPGPTTTVNPPVTQKPEDDVAKKFSDAIAGLTSGLNSQLTDITTQFANYQRQSEEQMAALRQSMLESQVRSFDRPEVAGVKSASGSAGDAMQIARRGVKGAFGRTGLRISSLNV